MLTKRSITPLGYRDVTNKLHIEMDIRPYDVIRGIILQEPKVEEINGNQSLVYPFHSLLGFQGRIFPHDEVPAIGYTYDILVKTVQQQIPSQFFIYAQIYHDFYPGEQLAVRISRFEEGRDPSFRLFNRIKGFVSLKNWKGRQIRLGDILAVSVESKSRRNNRLFQDYFILTNPLEIID